MFQLEESKYPNYEVCGIDEAGRGPIAGPLSIALVHFPSEIFSLVSQGKILADLNDSKKISEKRREKLYKELYSLPVLISHLFFHAHAIDAKGMNWCIITGIQNLVQKAGLQNPFLLIDGNYNFFPKNFYSYKSIVKGDEKIISIASASIIAKVKRDRFMKKINFFYPHFQFSVHKGYGTKLHYELIQRYGISPLHRKTFLKKFYENQSQRIFEF